MSVEVLIHPSHRYPKLHLCVLPDLLEGFSEDVWPALQKAVPVLNWLGQSLKKQPRCAVGRVAQLVSLSLLGHMVMSLKVSWNGLNFWIVDKRSGGLRCLWAIERESVHHL